MSADWTFEHTVPTLLTALALAGAAGFVLVSFIRHHLPRAPLGLALLGLRLLFLLLLFWVLLLPGRRRVTVEKIRPRLPVLIDTSASMTHNLDRISPETRWRKARAFLDAGWARSLRARCRIEVYPFADDLGAPVSLDQAAALEPDGRATFLHAALGRLFDRVRGQEILGVVVLSDGIDTRERRETWAGGPWPAPIYVAALETPDETEMAPDVRVDAVETPRRAVINWDTPLLATIAGNGIRGETFPVHLLLNGRVFEQASVQLPPDGGSRDIQFMLPHPEIGTENWTVRIPPLPREAQTNDNEMAVAVEVLDSQNRVLFLENTPRFESKHVVRELFANRTITPLAFFRGPGGAFIAYGDRPGRMLEISTEQLAENKIIILGDFDAAALDADKCRVIAGFVETGGSLVLLGGDRLWGAQGIAATPLARLLPFTRAPGPAREGRYPVEWTAEGRAHPAFVNNPDVPESLPPVLTVFGGAVPSAAAMTLATAETEAGVEPLLVSRAYGQGKVLAILTDSLWRWAMQPSADKPFAFFWRQIFEWMSPEAGESGQVSLELFTDAATLAVGEPVMLQARLIEPADAAPRTWKLACHVTAPSGRSIPLALAPRLVPGPGGREEQGYAVTFVPEEAGNWKAVVLTERDGRMIESAPCFFSARAVSQELAERPARVAVLRALAGGSGGRYAEPDVLDAILSGLQVVEKQERRIEYASLWQNRWLLACLIGLLALEWLLRKSGGMK
jgi:hypothetical protein